MEQHSFAPSPGEAADTRELPVERLGVDVVAADGLLLASAGERSTPDVFRGAREAGLTAGFEEHCLADTPIHDDLAAVTREPSYGVVFAERAKISRVLDHLAPLRVPLPVVTELATMRETDRYTYRHVLMTTALTTRMLHDLQGTGDEVLRGAFAALTHDFGKLRVPLAVLHKQTPLTRDEHRLLRQHPLIGCLLLHYYVPHARVNSLAALDHHERPDGSGYPSSVCLSDRLTQLIAVNDIFDALVSPRPYRERSFDVRGALEFLWAEARAGRVDESACRLLIAYNRHDKPDPWTMHVSDDIRSRPPRQNSYGRIAEG